MKKMPIAISRKIDLINSMTEQVKDSENIPSTYDGGTMQYYILIDGIQVKNQFVTILWTKNEHNYTKGKERYNINKVSDCYGDNYCPKHLNYVLNLIIRSYKKAIKN